MSAAEQWSQANEQYLAAALNWLRLKIAALASNQPTPESVLVNGIHDTDESTENQSPVVAAEQEMIRLEGGEYMPALVTISRRLGLARFEQNVLLLCAAMEFDLSLPSALADAVPDIARQHPTFGLALRLFPDGAWDVFSPDNPLRYWRLVEINQSGHAPLISSPLRAEERIVNYIKGLNGLDERVSSLLVPLPSPDYQLPVSQQAVAKVVLDRLKSSTESGRLRSALLTGADEAGKRAVAAQIAASLGLHVYRIAAEHIPAYGAELEVLMRLWGREALLLPVALYIDASDQPSDPSVESSGRQALRRFIQGSHGLVFVSVREPETGIDQDSIVAEVCKPTPAEQRMLWVAALGDESGHLSAMLAGQFNLNTVTIARVAAETLGDGYTEDAHIQAVWKKCCQSTRPQLRSLATRLDARATFDDIVLPEELLGSLHQIVNQVRWRGVVYDDWGFREKMNRGFGISALFAGESGTGKTMAAEVVASALGLDLYRVDLSAMVSKYIGETEKNLRRVFDAADDGGVILFIDEADALFGKRTEVKDSHDRYANIEINYLLQRMETFTGLAVLATNMKDTLDNAFLRRLRFVLNFPFPGVTERRLMWQKAFPPALPKGDLDYDKLARLTLTGGNIHTIAINAAFIAAGQSPAALTMPHVMTAARAEYRKLNKSINESDFRQGVQNGD